MALIDALAPLERDARKRAPTSLLPASAFKPDERALFIDGEKGTLGARGLDKA